MMAASHAHVRNAIPSVIGLVRLSCYGRWSLTLGRVEGYISGGMSRLIVHFRGLATVPSAYGLILILLGIACGFGATIWEHAYLTCPPKTLPI